MSWFKIDDKFHDHPKARKAGKAAVGVWTLAGAWSADHLTDGFVPAGVLLRWGTTADAQRLVDAGLWETATFDGEDGYRFLKWDRYQPTRADVKARREVRAAAGRAGGRASGAARREANASASVRTVDEPPSRPVPSRPVSQSARGHLAPVDNPGGLTDQDLDAIAAKTGGGRPHAVAVAATVLDKAGSRVLNARRYVLKAVDDDPDRHRYRGPRTKDTECPRHEGYPRDHCGACRSEQLTGGA